MSLISGTRESKLAMIQANMVKNALEDIGYDIKIKGYTSKGDSINSIPLYKMGSTGVFVDELNDLIINNEIDFAVHSAKDIPSKIDDRLEISGVLKRDDYHDILISDYNLNSLDNKTIGTSSMRRIKELKTLNKNIIIKDIRGNIDTRLSKYNNKEFDGIIMAKAAYDRMHLNLNYNILSENDFIPAPNQGIIAIVSKKDSEVSKIIKKINNENTFNEMVNERSIVKALNLGCSMPVGILSHNNEILLRFYSLKSEEYKDMHFNLNNNINEIINKITEEIKDYGYKISYNNKAEN